MKKNTYKLGNIDCASCGLKIEQGVNELDGVESSNLNFILQRFYVTFDENRVTDEEIETCIHKSLSGVQILSKNNSEYIDTYEEPKQFKKILFRGRNRKK